MEYTVKQQNFFYQMKRCMETLELGDEEAVKRVQQAESMRDLFLTARSQHWEIPVFLTMFDVDCQHGPGTAWLVINFPDDGWQEEDFKGWVG